MKAFLLAILKPMAARLTEPVVAEVKIQLHRVLLAVSLGATGVACVIVGLTYFASSLWHALVPALGTVGADLVLGAAYAMVAATLLVLSFRLVR